MNARKTRLREGWKLVIVGMYVPRPFAREMHGWV